MGVVVGTFASLLLPPVRFWPLLCSSAGSVLLSFRHLVAAVCAPVSFSHPPLSGRLSMSRFMHRFAHAAAASRIAAARSTVVRPRQSHIASANQWQFETGGNHPNYAELRLKTSKFSSSAGTAK